MINRNSGIPCLGSSWEPGHVEPTMFITCLAYQLVALTCSLHNAWMSAVLSCSALSPWNGEVIHFYSVLQLFCVMYAQMRNIIWYVAFPFLFSGTSRGPRHQRTWSSWSMCEYYLQLFPRSSVSGVTLVMCSNQNMTCDWTHGGSVVKQRPLNLPTGVAVWAAWP